tara:strand:+ start:2336 stop:3523 length:1188 start_codon:yes stop_codon:yes gene_type:complete
MTAASVQPLFSGQCCPLTRRLLGFIRLLRRQGFTIGAKETADAGRMASQLALHRPRALRAGLKALLCGGAGDWRRFDELFQTYWLSHGRKRAQARLEQRPGAPARKLAGDAGKAASWRQIIESQRGEDLAGAQGGEGRRGGASAAENLMTTDLRHIEDPHQMKEIEALAVRLAARLRYRLGRREKRRRQGGRLDVRRVIHQSIPTGGLPLRLAFRKRREQPLKLVLLLDASGSMSLYSTFFLRFISALLGQVSRTEAFVFHTRLVQVSATLRDRNRARALARMALISQGWLGGTRIGECLESFNRQQAKQVLTRRTAVLIVSDGYDTGSPQQLAAEMARIGKRAKKIIWLNPMIGWRDYRPTAVGMAAALPHIDLFAPAHNLASLAALEPYLAKL